MPCSMHASRTLRRVRIVVLAETGTDRLSAGRGNAPHSVLCSSTTRGNEAMSSSTAESDVAVGTRFVVAHAVS
jgi:hypothetical protein